MTLAYGFAKAKILSTPTLKSTKRKNETQYHLHAQLQVANETWDVAINVGTNDADDLLKYKLVFDFQHVIVQKLRSAAAGRQDLTGSKNLPALDYLRSDVLQGTGRWRDSDVMDGSDTTEPGASLKRLLVRAKDQQLDVYMFGRFYKEGDGVHDIHMNQGSKSGFVHHPGDDSNDHNDIWQDGGLIVDFGAEQCAAYFSAFEQQWIPTDELGNPVADAKPID